MKVLVTGHSGRVGRVVVDALSRDHTVWGLSDQPVVGGAATRDFVGTVTDAELLDEAMRGARTVVHLAGDPRPEAPWDSVLHNNVEGTYEVFAAARRAGVKRVVFASSGHASGLLTDLGRPVSPTACAPDSLYAVSKVFGEALGHMVSARYGISVICLRIGYLNERDDPYEPLGPVGSDVPVPSVEALAAMWISRRDLAQLVQRAVGARDDVSFGVFHGVSGRAGSLWPIDDARTVLGFAPLDGAGPLVADLPSDQ